MLFYNFLPLFGNIIGLQMLQIFLMNFSLSTMYYMYYMYKNFMVLLKEQG